MRIVEITPGAKWYGPDQYQHTRYILDFSGSKRGWQTFMLGLTFEKYVAL